MLSRSNVVRVLSVLNNIKKCIAGGTVEYFEFDNRFGICYHIKNNTGLNYSVLNDYLELLGLDTNYPVEHQVYSDCGDCRNEYLTDTNKFSTETLCGRLRLKLLDDLIELLSKSL